MALEQSGPESAGPGRPHQVALSSEQFAEGDRVLSVEPDQTILDAAEAAGIVLPFGCRYGGCVTCAARLVAGDVAQPEAVGLKKYMVDANYVLTCVAYATTDCELEVGVRSHFKGLYRNPFRGS